MVTIVNSLSGTFFSSDVPASAFTIDGYRVGMKIAVDAVEVFSEYLYPVDGMVSIGDLGTLLTPYARARLAVDVKMTIVEEYATSAQTNTVTQGFRVVFCDADVSATPKEFLETHFLSIFMGRRTTARGRLEYLHYIGTENATATARYDDGTTRTVDLLPTGGNEKYRTIDTSPDQFATDGKTLSGYTVNAGQRSQEYDIDFTEPDCAPILIFVNSFGVEELCYCTGTHAVAPQYKRQSMFIDGLLRNYDIIETRTFKADTGVLTTAEANWWDDLFRSRLVHVVNIYQGVATVGKEVVITDSKSEMTNDDAELPRFTFSYQYAQRNQNVLQLERAGRIFDNTFDTTFE